MNKSVLSKKELLALLLASAMAGACIGVVVFAGILLSVSIFN